MKINLTCILSILFIFTVTAEETKFWDKGRITPEQPFKAKVIGVTPGWGWDTIILKEEAGKGRYCLAAFGSPFGNYTIIEPDDFDRDKMIEQGTTFITPSVDVSRFSWTMGIWKHGSIFGEDDATTKYYKHFKSKKENKSQ
jgi:hypothetical protein